MISAGTKTISVNDETMIVPDIDGIENMSYKAYYYDNDTRCEVEIIEE